jgi:hypothetical protein
MGLLASVVVIIVVVIPPNVAKFNYSIIMPILSIGIKETRNTRNRDMAAPIVAVKNLKKPRNNYGYRYHIWANSNWCLWVE